MSNSRFRSYYKRMRMLERINVRNSIMDECKISTGQFYSWYYSLTRISDHQKSIISGIMQIEVSELFPVNE